MSVRRLRWWADDQLEKLERYLEQGLTRWSATWGIKACPEKKVACQRAHEHRPSEQAATWLGLFAECDNDSQARIAVDTFLEFAVFAAMFGPSHELAKPSGADCAIADQIVKSVCTDWYANLVLLLGGGDATRGPDDCMSPQVVEPPPKQELRAWSGALRVEILQFGLKTTLHLGAVCVERLMDALCVTSSPATIPRTAELIPVMRALESEQVRIGVELTAVEIDIGTLQSLATGDVIRLTHPLEQPLAVRVNGTNVLCAGFLGQKGGSRAITLTGVAQESMDTE